MELKAKVDYHNEVGSLFAGDTTIGSNYSEDRKQQMLSDFPDWFEVVEETKDALVIETPEAKLLGKMRKK